MEGLSSITEYGSNERRFNRALDYLSELVEKRDMLISLSEEYVSSSSAHDTMTNMAILIDEAADKLEEETIWYITRSEEMINNLGKMKNQSDADLLYERYVNKKPVRVLANERCVTESAIRQRIKKAEYNYDIGEYAK